MSVDQTETPNYFVIRVTVLGKRGKTIINKETSSELNK